MRTADERSVPFLMLYRENDPHPPSCWGGCVVAGDDARTSPGIYFARKPGEWDFLASGEEADTALVFYCFYKARQNVEMVWGGYTGAQTRCLAKILSDGQADCFWPPAIDNERMSVGAFVVNFEFRETAQEKGHHHDAPRVARRLSSHSADRRGSGAEAGSAPQVVGASFCSTVISPLAEPLGLLPAVRGCRCCRHGPSRVVRTAAAIAPEVLRG